MHEKVYMCLEGMGKRQLVIDWSKVPGASLCRKRLKLRTGEDGVYACPDQQCLHSGFKSKRGCRKHVDTKHKWIYYFITRPNVSNGILNEARIKNDFSKRTFQMPAFSVDYGIGKIFKDWLTTAFGGRQIDKESHLS